MSLGFGFGLEYSKLSGGGSGFTPPNKMTIESVELTNDTTPPNKMTIESVELT